MSIRDKAIEAIAQVMCRKRMSSCIEGEMRESYARSFWDLYAVEAAAALDAALAVLAEPDAEMVKAGNAAYEGGYEYGIDDEDMTLAFKAMIAKVSE